MVQRAKGVGKLGIQADHVKSEKLSTNLKPSGSLHQDGKTKGADYFKRKIKKSRSLSLDGLNPSSPRRKMSSSLPGRPPPPKVETPPRQSQPRVKARHVLPNYMKSTRSSDAIKENSQVTHLQSTPAASVAKVSRRRCSTGSPRPRLSSCAGKYSPSPAARNLKRPSSLKLVRTLTKAPSFKPARSTSAKKCTQVAVCADSSIQKATCSSNLKETKYPEYIMLNPGGTEAEGTSVFKVCPYTYCSLNGHRHAQLPPLKRFVAARRRLLKAQKSAKVVPVSPARFCQGSLGDKPACIKLDFEADFFVEIYAKREKEESLKIDRVVCGSEDEAINFSEEGEDDRRSSPSDEGSCRDGMTGTVPYDKHSDDGLEGGIVHDKDVENCRDAIETVINSGSDISQQKEETVAGDLDEVYSLIMIQKERMHPSLSHCDVDGDDLLEGAEDHDIFSADSTDDGWDEEDYSSSEQDDGETLNMTETEDGRDKDTLEYEEETKQEEKELYDCSPGLQEDGVDCASDPSKSSQVSDVLNETVEAAGVAEIEGLEDDRSQTESGVSFEEIDGDGDIGAQTVSTSLILQTQVDEASTSNSEEDACLEPQVDVCSPKGSLNHSKGLAEEIKVTAEPLTFAESIIVEEVGVQDEEETRAYEHASDPSKSSQVSDVLNETVEAEGLAEIEGLADDRSQTESRVSFEEIDGDGDIGAQTVSISLILQTQVDEASTSNSEEDACLEPQVDVCSPKGSLNHSKGLAEEIKVTAEPLTFAESIIVEEVGVQDEEETRAYEHASDTEIPTQLQIPGTSSEDSGEADGRITTLEFARGQKNDESSLLISTRLDGSGDDDNLEGFLTGELHQSEDHLEQFEKVDMNNAAEPSTSISVLNGTTLMSTKSKHMYLRRKVKSHEELSGPYMIWRINRREKCYVPDEEQRGFNPRDPNYLPIVPDPEGEKIDLRHQMIDGRRNSEEWMIDHALQRAVSKLAPARKKKVELLVEAFEKVMPVSQFETSIKSSSTGITQGRPIQTCS